MKRILTITIATAMLVCLPATNAEAAGTKLWNFSEIESWLEGEFQGTGLTSRGRVVPTMSTKQNDIPARMAWKSRAVSDGRLIATSLPAAIHLKTDDEVREVQSWNQLGVTAMERFNESVYAGISPSGKIYRYDDQNDTLVHVDTTSDSYIWSIEVGPDEEYLYLATGPAGELHRMSPDGDITRVASVPANNIMDLANYDGSLYVGDDHGDLYRLEKADDLSRGSKPKLHSVYGFNNGEVAAIASDGSDLYLAVNIRQSSQQQKQRQQEQSELAAQLRQQSMEARLRQQLQNSTKAQSAPAASPRKDTSAQPERGPVAQPPSEPRSPDRRSRSQSRQSMLEAVRTAASQNQSNLFEGLSGTIVYRMDPPEQMNIVYNDPNEIVHDLEAHEGDVYVATGGKGRLYKIKPDFTRVAYFQSDHKLILDVELEEGRPEYITTGEGAALFSRRNFDKRSVWYRSPPLDAELLSRWGTLKALGSDNISYRTRSGNSTTPDTNWTHWSPYRSGKRVSVRSEPARFLQFEARFPTRESSLRNVQIAYRIPNQQPQIANFAISPNPVRSMLTQSQSPGGSDNGSSRSASNQGNSGGSSLNVRQVGWKAQDPDGDPLQYTVFYRPVDSPEWLKLRDADEIEDNGFNWDLSNFSDGWYELRLEASDKAENPPGRGYTAYQELGPVLVDNTDPDIRRFRRSGQSVTFIAQDETSWILRAEYRINGEDWQPLQPEDGIFDQRTESFQWDLSEDVEGDAVIEVRVIDEGGNQTLQRLNGQ